MKAYIEHLKTRDTHDRRMHAMRLSLFITAFVFLVWVTTLGVRLASNAPVAQDGSAQVANVFSGAYTPATLEVVDMQ